MDEQHGGVAAADSTSKHAEEHGDVAAADPTSKPAEEQPSNSFASGRKHSEKKQLAQRRARLPTINDVDAALSKSIRGKIIHAVSSNEFPRSSSENYRRQLSDCLLSNNKDCTGYADLFLLIDHDNGKDIVEAFCLDVEFKIETVHHEESNFNVLQYAIEYQRWNAVQAILQLTRPEFIMRTRLTNPDSHEIETCLHRLIACGQARLTILLLAKLVDSKDRLSYAVAETLVHEWGERLKVSALHLASLGGQLDLVQYFVQEELVPADLRTNSMATAAYLAIRKGHVAIAQWLIETKGAKADFSDTAGLSFLHYAVLSDDAAAVQFALSLPNLGSQVDHWVQEDNPLLLAALRGNVDVVRNLLRCPEVNALLNTKSNSKGNTPLHNACAGRTPGDTAVALLLLSAGAGLQSFNSHRETPLMLAAQSGNADTVIAICAEFAQRTSASVLQASSNSLFEDISNDGKSVWHYAIEVDNGPESSGCVLRALLEFLNMCNRPQVATALDSMSSGFATDDVDDRGSKPSLAVLDTTEAKQELSSESTLGTSLDRQPYLAEQKTAMSPLHIAAAIGSVQKLKVLLTPAYSQRYSFFDKRKNTFLHSAARHGQTPVILCYATPTNINQQNVDGDTVLHISCRGGHFECVSKLLPMANVKLANKDGYLLLHELCACRDVTADILSAVAQRMRDVSWDMLFHKDSRGRTALHILSGSPQQVPADKLFSVFTKPSLIREKDGMGNAPIHTAIIGDQLGNLATLVNVFADTLDIDVRNAEGKTPLIMASERGQAQAVRLLLAHGANLSSADDNGNTALHMLATCSARHPEKKALYVEIIQSIVDSAVTWHCRQKRIAPVPQRDFVHGETQGPPKYWQCFREAVLKLVVLAKNTEGLNVLFLAAQVNAADVLGYFLGLEGALYLPKDARGTDGPTGYDVTDMVFNTLSTYDLYRPPRPETPIEADELDECGEPLLRNSAVVRLIKKESKHRWSSKQPALAEVIVNNGFQDCWKLLDIPAVERVTTDYWYPYRWLYIGALVLHMAYMSVLSHVAVGMVGPSAVLCYHGEAMGENTTETGSNNATGRQNVSFFNASFHGGVSSPTTDTATSNDLSSEVSAQLVLSMMVILAWPCAMVLRYGLFLTFAIARQGRSAKSAVYNLLLQIGLHPIAFLERSTSLILTMTFSLLVIAWFILQVIKDCRQHYVIAVAILFGWVYTVHFTSGIAGLHHFTIILQRIIFRDLMRFAFVFVLLAVAFALAFFVAVRATVPVAPQLPSEGYAVFAVFRALLGSADVIDMSPLAAEQFHEARSFISTLFVIYMVVTGIVMINMLIAMMNDSYHAIYTERKLVWRIDTLRKAHQLDRHYPLLSKTLRRALGSDKNIAQEIIVVDGQPLRRFLIPADSHSHLT